MTFDKMGGTLKEVWAGTAKYKKGSPTMIRSRLKKTKNGKIVSIALSSKGASLQSKFGNYWRMACRQLGYGIKGGAKKQIAPSRGSADWKQCHILKNQFRTRDNLAEMWPAGFSR